MPIRASSQGSVGTVANAAGGQATELQVHWNKRMFFHDDHITFEGQQDKSGGRVTVLHGENQRLLCDTLSIELDRVVSLFDSPPDLPSPTAKSFNCSGNVIVDDQQKAEDGSLKAILNGKFSAMTFFPATQYLIAEGDGEMRATFRDSAQHDSPAAGMMPRQNANTSNKEGLNYAYISFRDQMKGYLLTEQKNIDLYGDIQGLFVPVQTWQDQFNMVTYNRALRQGGVLLDCEHMQVIQTPNPPNPQGSLAVAANENASVEGETFFGKARSIKYNQAKQSVMFDGNASLTSHENGTHAAESFVYNVETGAIELIRLRSTTFGQ